MGGCGGEGNAQDDRAVWFSITGTKSALNWQSQISCETFDFCLPRKIAGWQPSALEPMEVPLNAIPTGNPLALLTASAELQRLATCTQFEIPVPDRLVPAALQTFLLALGCSVRSVAFTLTACIMTQLHMVSALARTRKLRVGEFWRQLGMASADRASVTYADPHKCPLCLT